MLTPLLQTNTETQKLAALICNAAPAEKIFLLGITEVRKRTTSVFNHEQPSCKYTAHYYVLVLVNKNDEQTHSCIQDKIENNLQHFIPVTAVVLWTGQFNNWLSEGHAFAAMVVQRSLLLHDNGEPLQTPSPVDETLLQQGRRQYYTKGLNLVQEFLAGAEMYRIRKQHAMAAFMLHQSAEHGLRTLMKVTTGLKTNIHNLDRLVRYCSMAVHGVEEVFGRDRQQGKHLFGKLQAAYIDARYKDYSISHDELLQLEQQMRGFIGLYRQHDPAATNVGVSSM
jgi:HEPN domain-containing protein